MANSSWENKNKNLILTPQLKSSNRYLAASQNRVEWSKILALTGAKQEMSIRNFVQEKNKKQNNAIEPVITMAKSCQKYSSAEMCREEPPSVRCRMERFNIPLEDLRNRFESPAGKSRQVRKTQHRLIKTEMTPTHRFVSTGKTTALNLFCLAELASLSFFMLFLLCKQISKFRCKFFCIIKLRHDFVAFIPYKDVGK